MARAPHAGPAIYEVAAVIKQNCLVEHGSLFEPGRNVWTPEAAELLQSKIGQAVHGDGSFIGKLKAQLTALDPEVILLGAELLYLELLCEADTGGDQKMEHLEGVLGLLPSPLPIPAEVEAALRVNGVASFGPGKAYRDSFLRFLARVVVAVKERSDANRSELLSEPWKFREIVEQERTSTDGLQAFSLLHIFYPDTFEYLVGGKPRKALVKAFFDAPGVRAGENTEAQLAAVRAAATPILGEDFDLYGQPFHRIWNEPPNDHWNDLVHWAGKIYAEENFDKSDPEEDFDHSERDYKLDLQEAVVAARSSYRDGVASSWTSTLRAAFSHRKNNLTSWQAHDDFLRWIDDDPAAAEPAFAALWGDGPLEDRLAEFFERFPRTVVSGAGTRASLASFLLMGTDGVSFLKPTVYYRMQKVLGHSSSVVVDDEATYRPDDLAGLLGVDPRRIRTFLRDTYPRDEERGNDWVLAGPQVHAVVERFGEAEDSSEALTIISDWNDLMRELRLRLLARGIVLRDALDAQGIAYWVFARQPPSGWSAEDKDAFLAFRSGGKPPPPPPPITPSEVSLPEATEELAAELFMDRSHLQEWVELLDDKKQIVFYGPPGTGKTLVAQRLAAHLGLDGRVRLVQFHPSYTYEDFIEGYRPEKAGGGDLSFELVPGALREIAAAAEQDPSVPHVLIVDEINRGNIAKIFGELYFLLEYRDSNIALQYSRNEQFSLPPNLFLIGTMNTADRSIALVDSALRRRFYFVELSPRGAPVDDVLRRWLDTNDLEPEAADLLDALNEAIADHEFAIGPSYFITKGGTAPDLERIWRRAILPLLEEHLFGTGRDVHQEFGLKQLRKKLADQADAEEGLGGASE